MNEHQPDWAKPDRRRLPLRIEDETSEQQALHAVRFFGRRALPVVVLADCESALSSATTSASDGWHDLPVFDPELIATIRGDGKGRKKTFFDRTPEEMQQLVVASARRFGDPALRLIRQQLVPSRWLPIIIEGGGVTLTGPEDVPKNNFEDQKQIAELQRWAEGIPVLVRAPSHARIVVEHGRTASTARVLDETDRARQSDQRHLFDELHGFARPIDLRIVNSGSELLIHPRSVSVQDAFQKFLEDNEVNRDKLCVIGISGHPHAQSIFDEADLSIGVENQVKPLVDLGASRGVESTKTLLKKVSELDWFDLARQAENVWEKRFKMQTDEHQRTTPRHWRDDTN